MKVAFFGGSFNPPHIAHVLGAAYVSSIGGFEKVLVVPVFEHAFDKALAPFEDRVRMCELAMEILPNVEVSRIEAELARPNYTVHTLAALKARHPDWALRLVIGSDVLSETERWHAFDRIAELAPPFVLGRVGADHADAPPAVLPEVSSTEIRAMVREGGDSAKARLRYVVPTRVLEYVAERGLYV